MRQFTATAYILSQEPIAKFHDSGKSMILTQSCQNRHAGLCRDGESILEQVEETSPRQDAAKGRFYASENFANGSPGKVLLLRHPKLQKWLPPGGHLEPNELPTECAIREALEETGLVIELIKQENIWISRWNATSFERPWLCLLENIPAHNDHPPHQHIDFIYLARPIGGAITEKHLRQHDIRWFSSADLPTLRPDEDIFLETLQTLEKIFLL